jgi:cystathionine beta-lyase/cystathionine gamma-synthase
MNDDKQMPAGNNGANGLPIADAGGLEDMSLSGVGHYGDWDPAHYSMRSQMVHGEYISKHWDYNHHVVPPMSCSATYRLASLRRGAEGFGLFGQEDGPQNEDILIYNRLQEPTCSMLEDRLAEAEGGEMAVSFSTGMAAISGVLGTILGVGDHVVAHNCLYGCTASLMKTWYPRRGIGVTLCNAGDPDELRAAITPETRVLYVESPVNPTLDLIDLRMVADIAAYENARRSPEQRIWTVCDNTFATPLCQRPIEHGIDLVVHSLTKGIGGFGTDMGGVVIGPNELRSQVLLYRKDFGGSLSPKAAWPPLVYGLPTLHVRMRQMQYSAHKVAEMLAAHPAVARVRYPGLPDDPQHALARRQMTHYNGGFMPGSMVYFTLKEAPGSNARAAAFIDWIADHSYVITLAVSLGQIKTLIENPSGMTHSALDADAQSVAGIEQGGIRLSLGIEETDDILNDLHRAFWHVGEKESSEPVAIPIET